MVAAMATAQAAPAPQKIGVVDFQQILQQAPQRAAIDSMMKSKFEKRELEVMDLSKQIESVKGQLQKSPNSSKLSTQLTELQSQFQLKRQLLIQDQQTAFNQAKGKMLKLLNEEVASVAKKDHLTLVIPSNAALYAAPSTEITKEVLAGLKASKVKVTN